ncbi:MAG: hypothetical protein LBD95_01500, partial [Clostridiales Family XIII bacterium]|nr:hypothetical protein [Clostridiales Family XIII bacterium]
MAVLLLLLSGFAACAKPEKGLSAAELLSLSESRLLEKDYEQAIFYFTWLIDLAPENARGYTG